MKNENENENNNENDNDESASGITGWYYVWISVYVIGS